MRLLLVILLFVHFQTAGAQSDLILRVGDQPPELDFTVVKGSAEPPELNWTHLAGRVVVIDFWATWCTPCIKAIPQLNALVEKFKDRPVTFLSITYEPRQMVLPFLTKHPMNSIVGSDNDFAMFRSFKAWGIPMVVLVNAEQRIAGVIHPDHLTAAMIDDVLEGRTPSVEPARGWKDPHGAEKYFRSLVTSTRDER
jgi:thiol-disulfide isomerase/thioredoxin